VEVYDEAELARSEAGSEWKPILQMITSRDGAAEIKNLRSGRYLVETRGPGGGNAVYAEISDKPGKVSNQVSLEWPFSLRGTLKTKSLSGELVSNNPWTPFQSVKVQLWSAGLGAPLASDDTGPQGRFRFNETRPGIYVVSIQGRQDHVYPENQIEGYLSVELSPSAPDALASLSLRLAMTSCGIEYSSCSAADTTIATSSRHIKVIYEPGMSEFPAVENAKYKLLDDGGASIAEGTTDRNGIAEVPSEFVGKATLVVASSGLTTVQQLLELLRPNEGAPDLVVTMTTMVGSASGCSAVTLEKHATP